MKSFRLDFCGRLFFACLFALDSSLDRSEKNLELDLTLFILRSSRKRLGLNDFILRANRLSVRANRTSGETTCFQLCKYYNILRAVAHVRGWWYNVVHSRSRDLGQGVCCNINLMLCSWETLKKNLFLSPAAYTETKAGKS